MNDLLVCLTDGLDKEVRKLVILRTEALMRTINYNKEIESKKYIDAVNEGWTIKKIETLCCLNAFYQVVLGPLSSASKADLDIDLIRKNSISYGKSINITYNYAKKLRECHDYFYNIIRKMGINFLLLQSPHADDLLYWLGNPQEHNE